MISRKSILFLVSVLLILHTVNSITKLNANEQNPIKVWLCYRQNIFFPLGHTSLLFNKNDKNYSEIEFEANGLDIDIFSNHDPKRYLLQKELPSITESTYNTYLEFIEKKWNTEYHHTNNNCVHFTQNSIEKLYNVNDKKLYIRMIPIIYYLTTQP